MSSSLTRSSSSVFRVVSSSLAPVFSTSATTNHTRYTGPQTQHQFSPHLSGALSQFSKVLTKDSQGSWITGEDDKKYLDFACGIGVTNLGHTHPRVTKAIQEQAAKGIHWQVNCVSSPPMIKLAANFGKILPAGFPSDYQVLFSNSGAESIENAVKLARHATGRQAVVVFQGGFHGRTIASGALTTAKYVYRAGFQPSMSGIHVVPFPYCHRCPISQANPKYCHDNCCNMPLNELKKLIKQQVGADEIAAVLIEPALGEGGYVFPPENFLKEVRNFCNETGALFVADEVQTGFGRTGTYFAVEQFGVVPDILVCAKGIANGLPLSAIVTSKELMSKAKPGSVGGTYTGNVLACAAANAVIDTITDPKEDILGNVRARGEQFRAGLKKLQAKYPIGDIRGRGLFNAIEFKDEAGAGVAAALVKAGETEGILLLNCGIHDVIRFIPPLTITEQEMTTALEKLDRSLAKVFPKA